MRPLAGFIAAAFLSACGSSDTAAPVAAPVPEIYRTVIEADGIPFEISWDRNDRTRAFARVFGVAEGAAIDPTLVIEQATGCRVTTVPQRVASDDGVPSFAVGTICAPARVLAEADAALSRELAREISVAVTQVSSAPRPAQQPGAASLYEGSPYAAFSADQLSAFCAEPWEERIAANGRTEYNPCRRRDAFR